MSVPPRGAVCRADLLRTLAVAPRERLAIDDDGEDWFGYVREGTEVAAVETMEIASVGFSAGTAVADTAVRLPLRMPFVHAIVERSSRSLPEQRSLTPTGSLTVAPLDEAAARAATFVCDTVAADLVPLARLLPALRRLLGALRPGALDVDRIVRQLATGKMPNRLPRLPRRRWHPDLVVVFDFRYDTWPYREDMHRLAESLLRHCGSSGVSLRICENRPGGPWKDWRIEQVGTDEPRPWRMPPAGTPVLIVGDLGLLRGVDSGICCQWIEFVASLRRVRALPVVLAPLGAAQVAPALARLLPILRWSPDAAMRAAAGCLEPLAGLEDLLAMVAVTRRTDPHLLRAFRSLNPATALDAGAEGALWCHADVERTAGSVRIAAPAQARCLGRFQSLGDDIQVEVFQLLRSHHKHFRAVLGHEEVLRWQGRASAAARGVARCEIEASRGFLQRLLATLEASGSKEQAPQWWDVAHDLIARADAGMRGDNDLLDRLIAVLARANRLPLRMPEWIDVAIVDANLPGEPQNVWLVRDAARGALVLQAQLPGRAQSALGEPLLLGPAGARLRLNGQPAGWLTATDLPQALLPLDDDALLQIEVRTESLTVAALRRPRGASGWACTTVGIQIEMSPLGGRSLVVTPTQLRPIAAAEGWTLHSKAVSQGGTEGLHFGIDTYGVWAEFSVRSQHGIVVQHLRWIEAGAFLMGSPEEEMERYLDEGPRHKVTISEGFWIADTACTQRLWVAVMGNNPARFRGSPLKPVERVSWNDVQEFLRRLEGMLPGVKADLPTEAEWEYACRAGTEAPFSFGERIDVDLANYNGSYRYPYAGGAGGRYRNETVNVKTFTPNGWGLYEMHGNVWEWCADGERYYDGKAKRDPRGAEGRGISRVVRGGSWGNAAGRLRSAVRFHSEPNRRNGNLGFRFVLRSTESRQVRPEQPGKRQSPIVR